MEFNTDKPTRSAMYLVDRGMQGKHYRWYNAETDTWSLCGSDMNEANANKDKPSPVGFFPWIGPLTGPKFDANKEVVMVSEDKPKSTKGACQENGTPTHRNACQTGYCDSWQHPCRFDCERHQDHAS